MEINLNFIYQISDGLNYFFLWIIFLAILGFALWAYLYSRWNVLGPRFKNRYSKTAREASKKEKTSIDKQIGVVQAKIDSASENNLSSQDILTLQTELERLEQRKQQEEQQKLDSEQQKQKEAELKQQIKQNKKEAKSKKKSTEELDDNKEQVNVIESNLDDQNKKQEAIDIEKINQKQDENLDLNQENRRKKVILKQNEILKLIENSNIYNHNEKT